MKEEFEVVMGEINQWIVENDFPLSVVQDVYFRLIGCQEPHYARQQLRFLKNVKRDYWMARRRDVRKNVSNVQGR